MKYAYWYFEKITTAVSKAIINQSPRCFVRRNNSVDCCYSMRREAFAKKSLGFSFCPRISKLFNVSYTFNSDFTGNWPPLSLKFPGCDRIFAFKRWVIQMKIDMNVMLLAASLGILPKTEKNTTNLKFWTPIQEVFCFFVLPMLCGFFKMSYSWRIAVKFNRFSEYVVVMKSNRLHLIPF